MPTGLERRFSVETELRMDETEHEVKFTGYAAVFNSFSVDFGGWKELIRAGAFSKSLSKNPDVRFLINHGDLPLARTSSGTMTLMEDKRGLLVEARLDNSDPDVRRLMPKMKRGDIDQMSFAFRTIEDNWRREPGLDIRELHEVDINDGDVSIVTYPAYQATEASLRGLDLSVASQEYEAWKTKLEQDQQSALQQSAYAMRQRHLMLTRPK